MRGLTPAKPSDPGEAFPEKEGREAEVLESNRKKCSEERTPAKLALIHFCGVVSTLFLRLFLKFPAHNPRRVEAMKTIVSHQIAGHLPQEIRIMHPMIKTVEVYLKPRFFLTANSPRIPPVIIAAANKMSARGDAVNGKGGILIFS